MPSAVVMASTITRSSLELMLDLIQKRDEQPKDVPPALPARPTSRGRLPSSRKSLPLNFKIGSIAPEPFSKDSAQGEHRVVESKSRALGDKSVAKIDHLEESPYAKMPRLESYEENLEEVAGRDSALNETFDSKDTVDRVLKKIAELEDETLAQTDVVQTHFCSVHAQDHSEGLKTGITALQSFIRGERTRNEFELMSKRRRAAVVVQKYAKRWITRTTFVNQKKDITNLQCVVRGWLARNILKELKVSKLNQDSKKDHLWVHHSVMEELHMRVVKAEALLRQKEEEHTIFQEQFEQYETKVKSMEEMWQKRASLQAPIEKHVEVHEPIPTEFQRRILKAEAALRQKEEETVTLRQQLQQYEMRWSEYEENMKSMEEMWQKQMASMQLSLDATRKSVAADELASPPEKPALRPVGHCPDKEGLMTGDSGLSVSTLARYPHASSTDVDGGRHGNQNAISLLVKEFEQRKQVYEEQVYEDGAGFFIAAKSLQVDSTMNEDLKRLTTQFTSWVKDYKVRLKQAKSALRKLGNARSEKSRKRWWFRG